MCKVQSHINSAACGGAEVGTAADSGVIVQSADLTAAAELQYLFLQTEAKRGD